MQDNGILTEGDIIIVETGRYPLTEARHRFVCIYNRPTRGGRLLSAYYIWDIDADSKWDDSKCLFEFPEACVIDVLRHATLRHAAFVQRLNAAFWQIEKHVTEDIMAEGLVEWVSTDIGRSIHQIKRNMYMEWIYPFLVREYRAYNNLFAPHQD